VAHFAECTAGSTVQTLTRHLRKLQARGLVRCQQAIYAVVPPPNALGRALLRLVSGQVPRTTLCKVWVTETRDGRGYNRDPGSAVRHNPRSTLLEVCRVVWSSFLSAGTICDGPHFAKCVTQPGSYRQGALGRALLRLVST
jgi:hypothetical protein